ncbi:transcriptional regulator FnrL [Roseivivax sp. CAU 1761]
MAVELLRSTKCMDCPIRHRAVCARCDTEEFARLEAMKYYRTFEPGQMIVWRGDRLKSVASVVQGVASVSQTLEDGRTQTVGLLLPSDFIGRPGRDIAVFDVTSVTQVTLCCFAKDPFEKLVETSPHISGRLLEMTLDELDAAREWMVLLGRKTAGEKIATFITMLARRSMVSGIEDGGAILELPLSLGAIANFIGLTLETASRQMSLLKRHGIIRLHGSKTIEILDYQRLAAAAGEDALSA